MGGLALGQAGRQLGCGLLQGRDVRNQLLHGHSEDRHSNGHGSECVALGVKDGDGDCAHTDLILFIHDGVALAPDLLDLLAEFVTVRDGVFRQRIQGKFFQEPLPLNLLLEGDDRLAHGGGVERAEMPRVYDFELMKGGGHLTGHRVSDPALIDQVAARLQRLAGADVMASRYGSRERGVLLYAMGDGNHSLATAKSIWEDVKKTLSPDQRSTHPARYALVELVNVHDRGLSFEAIHRVLFGVDVHLRTITRDGWVCTGYRPGTVHDGTEGELYDLADDPLQRVNRWDDPACAGTKADLLDALWAAQPEAHDPVLEVEAPV